MGNKLMNFYAMCWFLSILICLVLEGSYLSSGQSTVLNELVPFTVYKIGGIVPIPAFNIYFFHGVQRLLLWDYSFYEGGYEVLRWFWVCIFSPGAAWGLGSFFVNVFAQFVRVF